MDWFCIPHARNGDTHCAQFSILHPDSGYDKQCIPCFQYQKGSDGVVPRYQLPATAGTAALSVFHKWDNLEQWAPDFVYDAKALCS